MDLYMYRWGFSRGQYILGAAKNIHITGKDPVPGHMKIDLAYSIVAIIIRNEQG